VSRGNRQTLRQSAVAIRSKGLLSFPRVSDRFDYRSFNGPVFWVDHGRLEKFIVDDYLLRVTGKRRQKNKKESGDYKVRDRFEKSHRISCSFLF
jgi:hypothetical protein